MVQFSENFSLNCHLQKLSTWRSPQRSADRLPVQLCGQKATQRDCACFRSLCFRFTLFVHFGFFQFLTVSEIIFNAFNSFKPTQRPLRNSPANRKHRRLKMSSPIKSTASIEDLPWEMINELFKYLSPKDLATCSLVNKRWHSVYVAFKLQRLAVIGDDPEFYELSRWYNSNRRVDETERCSLAMFRRLAEKPLISHLKHLSLCGHDLEFHLNKLNRFKQLVHLEFNIGRFNGADLNLPRLRVLAFHEFNYSCALSIDCPELRTLLYRGEKRDANLLDVKHPETIQRLDTDLFGPRLASFKGVECLVTREFKAISKATLLSLPRLRELRYDEDIEKLVDVKFGNEIDTIYHVKRTLSKFMDAAKRLRGSDFRFAFSGLQLTNVNVDQIDFGEQVNEVEDEEEEPSYEWVCSEYIYMKNYHLIEPNALNFVFHVNYTLLLSHMTGEFPRCFLQKFTGINWVRVDGVVEDPDHLLWFLKSLRFLRNLILEKAELSQEFYDQLPAVARSLNSLTLYSQSCWKTELQLNIDFISELTCLSSLTIFQPLSLESLTSVARWLGELKEAWIYVHSRGDRSIKKDIFSRQWKITNIYGTLFTSENLDEIFNYLQR